MVGTLYRAITGDKIGAVEKIAGDTLYGGLWGAVGSVADVAFETATGKDFGATMLALVTGSHDATTAVADAAPKKDFGDRLWAMLTGSQDDAPVAVARVVAPTITATQSLPSGDLPALPADAQVAGNASGDPQIAALVAERGLSAYAQNTDGDVIFERMSRETPQRYRGIDADQQSMRLVGGTAALVRALVRELPGAKLLLNDLSFS